MRSLSVAVTLGLLLVAASAVWVPIVTRPPCDSPDVEAAAVVAQDFLNAQHTHGYKYVLNQIEDVKIISTPSGDSTYVLEVDLLETKCHVLDPTPLADCAVRNRFLTGIQGDCEVVLKKVGGVLSVTAFKCKTEESRIAMCAGCPTLLPLNHTSGLDFVHASLGTFNKQYNNTEFGIMEVGRMTSQLVSGGPTYAAEYVVIEAICFDRECIPLINATHGFCVARGLVSDHTVDCKMFGVLLTHLPAVGKGTEAPLVLPAIHRAHGLGHHQLTPIHDPELSGLLSADAPAGDDSTKAAVVKRETIVPPTELPLLLVPHCPGKIRHY